MFLGDCRYMYLRSRTKNMEGGHSYVLRGFIWYLDNLPLRNWVFSTLSLKQFLIGKILCRISSSTQRNLYLGLCKVLQCLSCYIVTFSCIYSEAIGFHIFFYFVVSLIACTALSPSSCCTSISTNWRSSHSNSTCNILYMLLRFSFYISTFYNSLVFGNSSGPLQFLWSSTLSLLLTKYQRNWWNEPGVLWFHDLLYKFLVT